MKIHAKNLTLSQPPSISLNGEAPRESISTTALTARKIEAESQRVLAEVGSRTGRKSARIRPPQSNRRIYSDSELKTATEMFLKLKSCEDRRPRPKAPCSEGSVDAVDRVIDTLLDLFDL